MNANKALSIKPDTLDAYYNMGIALQEQNKLGRGDRGLQQSPIIKPDYADAYYNMGIALQEQSKLEEAIEAYNKALSIKPDYARRLLQHGQCSPRARQAWKRR